MYVVFDSTAMADLDCGLLRGDGKMKPSRNINGRKDWHYISSGKTDVGATIRRIQRELDAAKEKAAEVPSLDARRRAK